MFPFNKMQLSFMQIKTFSVSPPSGKIQSSNGLFSSLANVNNSQIQIQAQPPLPEYCYKNMKLES